MFTIICLIAAITLGFIGFRYILAGVLHTKKSRDFLAGIKSELLDTPTDMVDVSYSSTKDPLGFWVSVGIYFFGATAFLAMGIIYYIQTR